MEKVRPSNSLFAVSSIYEKVVLRLLKGFSKGSIDFVYPDGRRLNFGDGTGKHASIRIRNDRFFKKIVLAGDVGLGESYVDGDWDTDDITNVITWALLNIEGSGMISGTIKRNWLNNLLWLVNRIGHQMNRNSIDGSRRNIKFHYDLSNEFYQLMLDSSMMYSCAVFKSGERDLQAAQELKLQMLCDDLEISPHDHILEIGCGWGGFAEYAAKKYGCRITGITISESQHRFATNRIQRAGLADRVEIKLQDYRTVNGQFDKIISVEMLEAVGHEFLPVFFAKCDQVLKPEGALVVQVITTPDSRYESFRKGVDWIQKHIFPGSLLPSVGALNVAANHQSSFHLFSLRDIGIHYATTLAIWRERFDQAGDKITQLGFDENFRRKWRYYLSYCEAAFASRNISDVQMIFVKPNNRRFKFDKR